MGTHSHSDAFAPPPAEINGRINLVGCSAEQIAEHVVPLGLKPFRARQLFQWIYAKGLSRFEDMTNLSKVDRAILEEHCLIHRPRIAQNLQSRDGTRKWLLGMSDGKEIEAVHIPEEDRGTLCVSSQVGCTLTCRFCHTGTQPLVRNLGPGEILAQILQARDDLEDWPSTKLDRRLTNIVLMGMGEPLYNYDNLAHALRITMASDGIAISKRRITLSTSGVVPMIRRAGAELGVNLAISLHAVTDELRSEIMPINRKYPLAELMAALRDYPTLSNARRITFEYVMLDGINDSAADARGLVKLIRGIPAKINLIPFNPWPGAPYQRSSDKAIARFADIMLKAGYPSPIRATRGEDIMAACGQLKSESERLRRGLTRLASQTPPEPSTQAAE